MRKDTGSDKKEDNLTIMSESFELYILLSHRLKVHVEDLPFRKPYAKEESSLLMPLRSGIGANVS